MRPPLVTIQISVNQRICQSVGLSYCQPTDNFPTHCDDLSVYFCEVETFIMISILKTRRQIKHTYLADTRLMFLLAQNHLPRVDVLNTDKCYHWEMLFIALLTRP